MTLYHRYTPGLRGLAVVKAEKLRGHAYIAIGSETEG